MNNKEFFNDVIEHIGSLGRPEGDTLEGGLCSFPSSYGGGSAGSLIRSQRAEVRTQGSELSNSELSNSVVSVTRGLPCEKLEKILGKRDPICPRCVEAYRAGSRMLALYIFKSYYPSSDDEEYHVAPAIFFMDKRYHLPAVKLAPTKLCGAASALEHYGFYWAVSRMLTMPFPVLHLLTTYPVLDGIPWSEEVFHQHGIDLGSELALLVLSQVDLRAPRWTWDRNRR